MNWFFRAALRLLPPSWRQAVRTDVEEEAHARGRGSLWAAFQVVRISPKLRWLFSGDILVTDLRYAFRTLVRARWFTVGAVCTFAIGVAAAIAVLTAVDRVLFRPLPYDHPDRIFLLQDTPTAAPGTRFAPMPPAIVPGAIFTEPRSRETGVENIASMDEWATLSVSPDVDDGTKVRFVTATVSIFDVLGVHVVRGRPFDDVDLKQHRRVVVITHESWRRRFGGVDDILGRQLWSRDGVAEIVGVLPRGFVMPSVIASLATFDGLVLAPERSAGHITSRVVVRLRPGVAPGVAAQELSAMLEPLVDQAPPSQAGIAPSRGIQLRDIKTVMFGRDRKYLWLVTAAAAVLLLLCAVNLSMLLLARGRARAAMASLQAALGASRARLLTNALLESLLICAMGSTLALAIVALTSETLLSVMPEMFIRYDSDWFDPRIVGLTLAITLAASLFAGAVPALRASRANGASLLQAGAILRMPGRRFGAALIVAEAALGIVLVSGATTAVRSFVRLANLEPGFNPADLYNVSIRHPRFFEPDGGRLSVEALEMLRRTPGVTSATGGQLFTSGFLGPFKVGGRELCCRFETTDGYSTTFGIPVLAGRDLSGADVTRTAPVALVSLETVAAFWPGATPAQVIGLRLTLDGEAQRQVIGVIGNARNSREEWQHLGVIVPASPRSRLLTLVARMPPGRPLDVRSLRTRAMELLGPTAAVSVEPIASHMIGTETRYRDQRFRAVVLGVFAVIALIVAVVGLYAVSAFDAAMRQREMSIRVALGASARHVRRLIVGRVLAPVAIGLVGGLWASWWTAQFVQSLVFGISARDPRVLGIVSVAFVGAALLAAWLPARRAAQRDPTEMLKSM